jgi:hypothetical protein
MDWCPGAIGQEERARLYTTTQVPAQTDIIICGKTASNYTNYTNRPGRLQRPFMSGILRESDPAFISCEPGHARFPAGVRA